MPPLFPLALRYLVWFVGLTFLYGLAVSFAGLPTTLASGVILASAPAADVGRQAARQATRPLVLSDWAVVWAVCMGVYLLLSVVGPGLLALTISQVREGIESTQMARDTAIVTFGTAVMMALFLLIGSRAAGSPGR